MRLSRREVLLAAALPAFAKKQAERAPNIVLLVADEVGAWMLGIFGNREFRTPNLDLLARSGTRFAANLACANTGAANHAALLTGRAPHQQGAQDAQLPELLTKAGYNCGPANSLEFLDGRKAGERFFLMLNYSIAGAQVAPKHEETFAKTTFNTLGWEPVARNAARNKEMFGDILVSLRRRAAAMAALDDQIPPLLSKLERGGLRDETLIVFTSDCGSLVGRHGLWGDGAASEPANMYDEVMATPLIWNWRGKIPVEGTRPELVSAYDLLPTLCEVAGAALPAGRPLAGRSYWNAVLNQPFPKKEPWRNLVFAESGGMEMAREIRYKLVLRDQGRSPSQLFDLAVDPREKINQYENPSFVSVRDRLLAELASWRKR